MKLVNFFRPILSALPLLFAWGLVEASPPYASNHASNRATGSGHFQTQPASGIFFVLPAATAQSVICRYRSRFGNCFRILRSDKFASGGAISIPVGSEASFRQFASELLLYADGVQICEISERWSPWREVLTRASRAYGDKREQRFCRPGPVSDAPACACRVLRETRRKPEAKEGPEEGPEA